MLDGKLFVVMTKEDYLTGMYAIAQKIPRTDNLVHHAAKCKTLNVCKKWKDAKKLEKQWNADFWNNGTQKIKLS